MNNEVEVKKNLLEKFSKEETEVELSYCEKLWPKGLMLLHIIDKFGYKLEKKNE